MSWVNVGSEAMGHRPHRSTTSSLQVTSSARVARYCRVHAENTPLASAHSGWPIPERPSACLGHAWGRQSAAIEVAHGRAPLNVTVQGNHITPNVYLAKAWTKIATAAFTTAPRPTSPSRAPASSTRSNTAAPRTSSPSAPAAPTYAAPCPASATTSSPGPAPRWPASASRTSTRPKRATCTSSPGWPSASMRWPR